jgi:prophage regulatory protein
VSKHGLRMVATPGDLSASVNIFASARVSPAGHGPRPITLIGQEGLKERGIYYSRSHLWRLEAVGRFPRRVKLGNGRVAWVRYEVDDYLCSLAAARCEAPFASHLGFRSCEDDNGSSVPVE